MLLKSKYRNFKLMSLDNPLQFSPNEIAINKFKQELRFIKSNFPNDIITGSIALNLFSLINRDSTDIDILIKDESRFSNYENNNYEEVNLPNRLGYIYFYYKNGFFSKKRDFQVDFFKSSGLEKYIQFYFEDHTFKVQNPLEIIQVKMELSQSIGEPSSTKKHENDLNHLFDKFSNEGSR